MSNRGQVRCPSGVRSCGARWGLAVLAAAASLAADPVEIKVDGTGWLQDRRLARSLDRLRADPEAEVLNANGVEDAVFFLFSALAEEGYLRPEVEVDMTRRDGTQLSHRFDADLTQLLPRPLQVTEVVFRVEPGTRYTFEEIEVEGELGGLTAEDVRDLLLPRTSALSVSRERAYSPGALNRGLGNVTDALDQRGYAQAEVEASRVDEDHETGAVDVTVRVQPGPLWRVASLQVEGEHPDEVEAPELQSRTGEPWTTMWEQDAMEALRQAYFSAGYPDVRVRATRSAAPPMGDERPVHVSLAVEAGPRVTVGPIRFAGEHGVQESVLQRRVRAEEGDPLDPLQFEAARYRLSQLGAFRRVELDFEPPEGRVRSPVFTLTPLPEWEVHLLAGYGSYEQLRGGVEVRRNNVLGRAHQARLELVQSFKSTNGEITYTVPELFGERLDGSVQLFALQREELAFERQEYGGTVSLRRRQMPWIGGEGTVSYTYQSLRNDENELTTRAVDTSETIAASIDLALSRDERDSPLAPREGYRWFVQTELASEALGGEVDYQRVEFGVSYHLPWGRTRWIHASLTHGAVLTLGAEDDRELPVNRRFYPGGDSSIRGFQLGEAAPRGPGGRFIGAKTTTLLNLELEQAIVGQLTGVVFVDALGMAAQLEGYPIDEHLLTVGLGLRYQTIIGPVRLEYGHNLNPREHDPDGTLHFSLGFPF